MKTLVILVNRNNKSDTIECLESLRRCEGDFDVLVADNGSTDGSMDSIAAWARGEIAVDTSASAWDAIRDHDLTVKEVSFGVYGSEAEAIADPRARWLTVASTGGSRGFPAGNNLGMRYGLTRDYGWFWILNNDTVVEPTALVRLVEKMQADPSIGVCGSTLVFYGAPKMVQAWGVSLYDPRFATSKHLGYGSSFPPAPAPELLAPINAPGVVFDYVVGAAMFCSRALLEEVGLMNADLYLYHEEIDWTVRMRPRYRNGYEPLSVVFHKHGGTTGGRTAGGRAKPPSRERIYYITLNRVMFTKAHFPAFLPTVVLKILFDAARTFAKGQVSTAGWMLHDTVRALTTAKYPLGPIG